MIQVAPRNHVQEPRIPDLNWSEFHQALAVVSNVVNETIEANVGISVSASHHVTTSRFPEDKDRTMLTIHLNADNLVGISPAPRILVDQVAGERLDCEQFLEKIEDGCYEIIRVWQDIIDGIRKARRLFDFQDDGEKAPETAEDIRPPLPSEKSDVDIDAAMEVLGDMLVGLDAEAGIYGDDAVVVNVKDVAGCGEDLEIPVSSANPKAAAVTLRSVASEIGNLAAEIENRLPRYATVKGGSVR